MKLSLICIALASLSLIGCAQPISYSHTKDYDHLVIESHGDNIADYEKLHDKADEMCRREGKKDGVNVLDSRSGMPQGEENHGSYHMSYTCKEPSIVDQASAWAKKIKEFAN